MPSIKRAVIRAQLLNQRDRVRLRSKLQHSA